MQVTIGAKGGTRKTLVQEVVEQVATAPERIDSRRLNDPKVRSFMGHVAAGLTLSSMMPKLASAAPISRPPVMSNVVEAGTEAVPVIAEGLKSTVLHAFDPLIDLIMTLSYPVAGVMIAGGCLFIMVGQRERGMGMLQNAAIGYILVQLSPMLLKLLVGIGESV
ncbi:hypothetical protein MO973_33615 [Paenibacillus sp. TRM 82003]|nr:hypothetical protein [Paenibacillus sp. TRM 82003]